MRDVAAVVVLRASVSSRRRDGAREARRLVVRELAALRACLAIFGAELRGVAALGGAIAELPHDTRERREERSTRARSETRLMRTGGYAFSDRGECRRGSCAATWRASSRRRAHRHHREPPSAAPRGDDGPLAASLLDALRTRGPTCASSRRAHGRARRCAERDRARRPGRRSSSPAATARTWRASPRSRARSAAGRDEDALPPIGLAPGGTVSTVARNWGIAAAGSSSGGDATPRARRAPARRDRRGRAIGTRRRRLRVADDTRDARRLHLRRRPRRRASSRSTTRTARAGTRRGEASWRAIFAGSFAAEAREARAHAGAVHARGRRRARAVRRSRASSARASCATSGSGMRLALSRRRGARSLPRRRDAARSARARPADAARPRRAPAARARPRRRAGPRGSRALPRGRDAYVLDGELAAAARRGRGSTRRAVCSRILDRDARPHRLDVGDRERLRACVTRTTVRAPRSLAMAASMRCCATAIEAAGRLVEEEHGELGGERTRERPSRRRSPPEIRSASRPIAPHRSRATRSRAPSSPRIADARRHSAAPRRTFSVERVPARRAPLAAPTRRGARSDPWAPRGRSPSQRSSPPSARSRPSSTRRSVVLPHRWHRPRRRSRRPRRGSRRGRRRAGARARAPRAVRGRTPGAAGAQRDRSRRAARGAPGPRAPVERHARLREIAERAVSQEEGHHERQDHGPRESAEDARLRRDDRQHERERQARAPRSSRSARRASRLHARGLRAAASPSAPTRSRTRSSAPYLRHRSACRTASSAASSSALALARPSRCARRRRLRRAPRSTPKAPRTSSATVRDAAHRARGGRPRAGRFAQARAPPTRPAETPRSTSCTPAVRPPSAISASAPAAHPLAPPD